MRVIILEDCTPADVAAVLMPYSADHIADASKMVDVTESVETVPHKAVNPRSWTEEESAPLAAAESRDEALRAFFEMFPDSARTRKAVEGRWYRLHPRAEPEPEPVLPIETPEPEPEPVPVGHTRSWQAVESDVVAQCATWPQAVEAYQEAFPGSLRTAHAVEMRWYYLRKKGLLTVPEESEPALTEEELDSPAVHLLNAVDATNEMLSSLSEAPVDTQPETPAAELTTLCYVPEWPEPPTDAPDVTNEDALKHLYNRFVSADIPSERGGTTYLRGHIRKVLSDMHVLIECEKNRGAIWCHLINDNVTRLDGDDDE